MPGFRCYISPAGDDEVERWYLAQSPNVRGAVCAVIEALHHRPRHLWRRKPYGVLRGALCAGLGEIRIEEPRGLHHRILGFFAATTPDFVMLYAFAKDSGPAYKTACPEARKRRSYVEQNYAHARECQFPAAGGIAGRHR